MKTPCGSYCAFTARHCGKRGYMRAKVRASLDVPSAWDGERPLFDVARVSFAEGDHRASEAACRT